MRILLIGPSHQGGSIPPYLDVLAGALRGFGVHVDRVGSGGVPYDPDTGHFRRADDIIESAERLLHGVDLNAYDLLSVHFGNLEIEQLLPYLWRHRPRPPAVYHAHSLDWTLFTRHVPDPQLRALVDIGVQAMDGYVYFGAYGRDQLARRLDLLHAPSTVSWLPTTIPAGQHPQLSPAVRATLGSGQWPTGTLYGYPAPWKDIAGLIAACESTTTRIRITLAGPFWDNPRQAGIDLEDEARSGVQHGPVHVSVQPIYLDPINRRGLVAGSDFAIFPYRSHPTFQGSGAIADYLAHAVPVLATDVANMAELVGRAGVIVPAGDTAALADSLDRIAGDPTLRRTRAQVARERSHRFSATHHGARCLRLYETVAAKPRSTAGAKL